MEDMNIHVNSFVHRQTEDSRFSHFDGTWVELKQVVENSIKNDVSCVRPGHTDGVILVSVSPERFYTNLVILKDGDILTGTYCRRTADEEPRKVLGYEVGDGCMEKKSAHIVDIVLYRSDVLFKTNQNELPPELGNWEIISVNASPFEEKLPINPETLMHNHFGSSSGTLTGMSDSEFVEALRESFIAWKDKVHAI